VAILALIVKIEIRSPFFSLVLVAGLSLLGAGSADSATFTANPVADALVTTGPTGNLINNNYGGAGSFSLSAGGLEMGELQTVLRFDLSGAVNSFDSVYGAGQWTVESVNLRLTAANANNAIFNSPAAGMFQISWMLNDSWEEGTGTPAAPGATGITFSSLQSTFLNPNDESLGVFNFNGTTSGNYSFGFNLTAGLVGDVTSGDDLSLRLSAADAAVSGVFNSRNFGTVGNRPFLTIVAVPEPGTIGIVGLGLVMAALSARRSRRTKP
jgi:hypothetical protein